MGNNESYYRGRIEEEPAAAERTIDPAIAQIHLDMAKRYRDRLNSDVDPVGGAAGRAEPMRGAYARQGTALA